jgi:ferredoxin
MRVIVNWSLCDGNGCCAQKAPELFTLDESGTLHVLQETFGDEWAQRADQAVQACPKCALSIASSET